MEPQFRAYLAFHLAGARTHGAVEPIDDRGLRPALLAPYRDLTALRYDYPLVLVHDQPARCVRSLTELVDELLRRAAPRGPDGESRRRDVLRVEREVRARLAAGATGTLAERWAAAAARCGVDVPALEVDGELLDCGRGTARKLIAHVWRAAQQVKVQQFRALTSRLVLRLEEILRADFLGSAAGRTEGQLRASFGGADGAGFDFGAMSRILTRSAATPSAPARLERVRAALAVIQGQTLFAGANGATADGYAFGDCAAAMAAHRARLPEMRRLARALAIAELEVAGLYVEARHDALLDRMYERDLRPADVALFPDTLVCVDADRAAAGEGARLLELLSSGMPAKVVVDIDDLDDARAGDGHGAFGVRRTRLAAMAMGLGQVHVVQAPASALYAVRDRLLGAVTGAGPALISVFAGAAEGAFDLPPYLVAAAALQSRPSPRSASTRPRAPTGRRGSRSTATRSPSRRGRRTRCATPIPTSTGSSARSRSPTPTSRRAIAGSPVTSRRWPGTSPRRTARR